MNWKVKPHINDAQRLLARNEKQKQPKSALGRMPAKMSSSRTSGVPNPSVLSNTHPRTFPSFYKHSTTQNSNEEA